MDHQLKINYMLFLRNELVKYNKLPFTYNIKIHNKTYVFQSWLEKTYLNKKYKFLIRSNIGTIPISKSFLEEYSNIILSMLTFLKR